MKIKIKNVLLCKLIVEGHLLKVNLKAKERKEKVSL